MLIKITRAATHRRDRTVTVINFRRVAQLEATAGKIPALYFYFHEGHVEAITMRTGDDAFMVVEGILESAAACVNLYELKLDKNDWIVPKED